MEKLPETILPILKKAEIHVYRISISQYLQELSETFGEELPTVLPAGPHSIYALFIPAHPLAQIVHFCYCHGK